MMQLHDIMILAQQSEYPTRSAHMQCPHNDEIGIVSGHVAVNLFNHSHVSIIQ